MHFLVNSVRTNIQEELVIELYKEDEFAGTGASPPPDHHPPPSSPLLPPLSSSPLALTSSRPPSSDMLREADDAVRKRDECITLVTTLEKAHRVLDELRAMPIEGALDGGMLESLSLSGGSLSGSMLSSGMLSGHSDRLGPLDY